jgi:hypothetical protein
MRSNDAKAPNEVLTFPEVRRKDVYENTELNSFCRKISFEKNVYQRK